MGTRELTQREVTSTMTETYVYDPSRVNDVYAALKALGFECVMGFASQDADERAQELFEALYESQVFHEVFYGIRDPDTGYEHATHDPEA